MEELVTEYYPLAKRYWLIGLVGLMSLYLIGYGLNSVLVSPQAKKALNDSSSPTPLYQSELHKDSHTNELKEIVVDIEGAVNKPGVYHMKSLSRIEDAVKRAGGFSDQADPQTLAKTLNLAAKLNDGAKI